MIYDVGDGANLRHTVRNADGTLVAATVSLAVTKPDGTTTAVGSSPSSTGVYDSATFVVDQPGFWSYRWTVSGTVIDVADGQFFAATTTPGLYSDLATVRAMMGITAVDATSDLLITNALKAASRLIDTRCGRRFYRDLTASARTFFPDGRVTYDGAYYGLTVDDIATASGLLVGGVSWSGVGPATAVSMGKAITYLRSDAYAANPFLYATTVTAIWGWPAVPDEISQATALLASRFYRRKDSPQGVIGSDQWGTTRISRLDPDVEALIAPYRLPGFA